MRVAILPQADVSFDDGWYVQGLGAPARMTITCRTSWYPGPDLPLFTTEPVRGSSPAFRMG